MATPSTITVIEMARLKDTKNTVIFEAADGDAAIDRVYVSKASPEAKAQHITLTVTVVD